MAQRLGLKYLNDVKFCTDVHDPEGMNPTDFGDFSANTTTRLTSVKCFKNY